MFSKRASNMKGNKREAKVGVVVVVNYCSVLNKAAAVK